MHTMIYRYYYEDHSAEGWITVLMQLTPDSEVHQQVSLRHLQTPRPASFTSKLVHYLTHNGKKKSLNISASLHSL